MTKKLHPADIADRAEIARAVSFNVHLRRSPTDKVNEEAKTLAEAVAIAERMDAESPSRRALIYAITPEGKAIHVPQDMKAAAKESTMTITTNLTAIEVAKLTAAITGGAYKRSNSKDAAVKRFLAVANENLGEALTKTYAKDILGAADFQAAQDWLATAKEKAQPKAEAPAAKAKASKARPAVDHSASNALIAKALKADPKFAEQATAKPEKAKPVGKRAAVLEAAQAGQLPEPPDFSAATHTRFRKKLDEIVALVKAGDIEGLKAYPINPISSSPKAMDKYRNLAVIALEARAAKKNAA